MDLMNTVPQWLIESIGFLPPWLTSTLIFGLATAAALIAHRVAFAVVTRLVAGMDLFWRSLVSRTHGPTRFAMITVALAFAASVSPLTEGQAALIRAILLLCFIALTGWIAKTALHIWTTVYLRRFKLDAEDNLLARKHVTQTRILRRVGDFMIVIVGVSAMLMTFDGVRQYGVSLLASAGAAGLVVGLALQPVSQASSSP
jgi:small-conductance mechanosensitive channel